MDAQTHAPRRNSEALDDRFDALSHHSRRVVLEELAGDGPRELEALAERLAEESETLSQREAAIALVHTHLPLLEDAGLVAYDRTTRRCELAHADTAASVRRVLHAARSCA